MSYAVSGLVRDYRAPGYAPNKPMVPHGFSVIVNAPAAFRFTAASSPARHRAVLQALGGADEDDVGEALAQTLTRMMKGAGVPNGLEALGYSAADIPALTEAAFPQRRLLDNAPRVPSKEELAGLFHAALRNA
jgi:alcohol dehydrogenase class IV